MSTRSELEEERRLFYVVLTRAEHQVYLTYAQSRYRWGKLTESEPSRFIEEIDPQYLEYLTPAENNYRYKPMIDSDNFANTTENSNAESRPDVSVRKLKPMTDKEMEVPICLIQCGRRNVVMHERFGKGQVLNLEGGGADKSGNKI
jgi:DNA helicase-2/ATP-dependent DNA helicase PcrA